MENIDWVEILAMLLAVAAAFLPVYTRLVKKIGQIADKLDGVSKELKDVFVAVSAATEDGQLTPDEIRNIVHEASDVVEAIKDAISSKQNGI